MFLLELKQITFDERGLDAKIDQGFRRMQTDIKKIQQTGLALDIMPT